MNEVRIELFKKEVPIEDYIRDCVDAEKFEAFCRRCSNYGKIWSCPPFEFSVGEVWRAYKTLLLYGKKITLKPELTAQSFTPEELRTKYTAILKPVKRDMLNELFAMENERIGCRALSAGSCEGCAVCARKEGLLCRKPEVMRHSIESLGGDVGKSLELYFGERLIWAESGRLPEHFFLLGGLLIP